MVTVCSHVTINYSPRLTTLSLCCLVATPTFSREPTPTDGRLPAAHQTTPSLTSENPELPLAEQQDTHKQLKMSVPPAGPGPEVRPASPHSSSEESSNTSSNIVTAGTDAALRLVSDGELLSSVQLEATMTGTFIPS